MNGLPHSQLSSESTLWRRAIFGGALQVNPFEYVKKAFKNEVRSLMKMHTTTLYLTALQGERIEVLAITESLPCEKAAGI